MRSWLANLTGLVAGLAIGGAVAVIWFSPIQMPRERDVATPPRRTEAALPALHPVELPRLTPSLPERSDPVPTVVRPDPPAPRRPGSGVAGTGFFVAADGSLLTAAHVVSHCAQIRIISKLVGPAQADTLATDLTHDVALLRAAHVTPPAVLSIAPPATAEGRLFVLGYPANGGLLIPSETWATLENARFPPAPAQFTDPGWTIWMVAAIGHGYSGGPILDPRNGAVVGIVRGIVDSTRLHAAWPPIPASGMAIGPGSSALAALLRQQRSFSDALPAKGQDAVDAARRATVHVICLF